MNRKRSAQASWRAKSMGCKPGETRELQLEIAPETRFVGAIAAFRDIRNAKWKVLSAVPTEGLTDENKVTLSVARSDLQLSIAK